MCTVLFPFLAIPLICPNLLPCDDDTGRINGYLTHHEDYAQIYLLKITDPSNFYTGAYRLVVDSTAIREDGYFEFHTDNLDTNYVYRLNIASPGINPGILIRDYQSNNYIFFTPTSSTVTIHGDATRLSESYTISGGPVNDCLARIRDTEKPIYGFVSAFADSILLANEDPEIMDIVRSRYFNFLLQAGRESIVPALDNILNACPDPRVYAMAINHLEDLRKSLKVGESESESAILAMVETWPDHEYSKAWSEIYHNWKYVLPIGSQMPDLELPDTNGNLVKLSSLQDKLILVDFWASWCLACRNENRDIVKPLFAKYGHEGFGVYGVSLDDKKANWIKAIKHDDVHWTHVSDLLGNRSPIYQICKLQALPTTYLIDSNQTILAKDVRGELLTKFVQNYLSKAKR